jgi:hypothetical protein
LGIYCLIEAFIVSESLVYAYAMPEEFNSQLTKMIIASLSPSITLLIFALVLLLLSKRLADIIVPKSADEQIGAPLSLEGIQPVLFSVAGVLIFASAIPRTFAWISQLFSLIANDSHGLAHDPKIVRNSWISLALSSIEMLIGIGLFFASKGISIFWQRIREWTPATNGDERT